MSYQDMVSSEVLQELEVEMFGRTYVLHPSEDLLLQVSTIGEALQTQPNMFAFYGTIRDMANSKVESLEAMLQRTYSEVSRRLRTGEMPEGLKVTDETVKDQTRGHLEYIEVQDSLINARVQRDQLNSIVKAFEDRRACLIALANRQNNTAFNDNNIKLPDAQSPVISEAKAFIDKSKTVGQFPKKKGK